MTKHVIRVLNNKGDEPLATWDPADEISAEEARRRFDEIIREGYLAFRCDEGSEGTREKTGEKITRFDPMAKVIFVFPRKQFAGG